MANDVRCGDLQSPLSVPMLGTKGVSDAVQVDVCGGDGVLLKMLPHRVGLQHSVVGWWVSFAMDAPVTLALLFDEQEEKKAWETTTSLLECSPCIAEGSLGSCSFCHVRRMDTSRASVEEWFSTLISITPTGRAASL